MLPAWHTLDLRLMFSRYQTDGTVATANNIATPNVQIFAPLSPARSSWS